MLLAHAWAAQIVRVRVERVGRHRVAGIDLSGVKLKHAIDPAGFEREAAAIADDALSADMSLEEVDVRAFVPAALIPGPIAVGDVETKVTSRTVFTLTVQRGARAQRLTYWNPIWRAGLRSPAANRSRVVR